MKSKKYYPIKGNNKKGYYPRKRNNNRRNYPVRRRNTGFNNNFMNNRSLVNPRTFNKGNMVSAHIERKIIIKDRFGNVQTAIERQFINAGDNIGVAITGSDRKYDKY